MTIDCVLETYNNTIYIETQTWMYICCIVSTADVNECTFCILLN